MVELIARIQALSVIQYICWGSSVKVLKCVPAKPQIITPINFDFEDFKLNKKLKNKKKIAKIRIIRQI